MSWGLGITCALIALLGWGIGDFLIQRSTRIIGGYRSLFVIASVASIVLFPLTYTELATYSLREYGYLTLLSTLILVFALVLFEAFRIGKMSVVEAVVAIELPLTVGYAVLVGGESLSYTQSLFFVIACLGVLLVSAPRMKVFHRARLLEKGVVLAIIAAVLSALTNYYVGRSSQELSPLFTMWFRSTFLMVVCGAYIVYRGEMRELARDVARYPKTILGQALFDNVGWAGFAFAVTMIPISIAVTISESYIIVAALLGYWIGRERLHKHQIWGAVAAFSGVLLLSATLLE